MQCRYGHTVMNEKDTQHLCTHEYDEFNGITVFKVTKYILIFCIFFAISHFVHLSTAFSFYFCCPFAYFHMIRRLCVCVCVFADWYYGCIQSWMQKFYNYNTFNNIPTYIHNPILREKIKIKMRWVFFSFAQSNEIHLHVYIRTGRLDIIYDAVVIYFAFPTSAFITAINKKWLPVCNRARCMCICLNNMYVVDAGNISWKIRQKLLKGSVFCKMIIRTDGRSSKKKN